MNVSVQLNCKNNFICKYYNFRVQTTEGSRGYNDYQTFDLMLIPKLDCKDVDACLVHYQLTIIANASKDVRKGCLFAYVMFVPLIAQYVFRSHVLTFCWLPLMHFSKVSSFASHITFPSFLFNSC